MAALGKMDMAKERHQNTMFYHCNKAARDLWRLISVNDVLDRIGTVMIRKSPRMTLLTAAITSSGYISSSLGLPGFSGLEAIAVPCLVFGGMLGGGTAMRFIPRAIFSRLTTIAEANDLNLMEDYRKSQALEHLNVLWDRVFWYESDQRYSRAESATERDQIIADREFISRQLRQWPKEVLSRLGIKKDEDIEKVITDIMTSFPLTDKMEKSREGFIASSLFALRHALPQSSQAKRVGYRINLWEDERDGAYYDRTDVKLFEQYFGNATITDIKNEVGFCRIDCFRELPGKLSRKAWFHLITRKVAIETGRALKVLNDKYETDMFNSQALLWPGEEDAEWLDDFSGAREEILSRRKRIIRNALGDTVEDAARTLDRMLLPLFRCATELRFRYDPEYLDGSLDHDVEETEGTIHIKNNIVDDLIDHNAEQKDIDRFARKAEQAKKVMSQFVNYLEADYAWLRDKRLALRAVKIAFHINKNGMKDMFNARSEDLKTQIQNAVKDEPVYTHRLIALRLHHTLSILQKKGYMDLSLALAYQDGDNLQKEKVLDSFRSM